MTTDDAGSTAFYDTIYGSFAERLSATIRAEAFGEDIGQSSWLTADEHRHFARLLDLGRSSEVLDVASGSGGPALFLARETGCQVTGVDLHEAGVDAGNQAAAEQGVAGQVRFLQADARQRLPFDAATFDAVICIDSINHLYEREHVLREWHRVLRPGGRVLFTDPITVAGMLRREEMIIRSGGMGEFVFTPVGVDESLLRQVGFTEIEVEDVTANMAAVSGAEATARDRHASELDRAEGGETNARLQEFLRTVEHLAHERRLLRLAYLARKSVA
jgi:SAM-dependent methyltransferase